jgi:UMF1 family MFS transporter
MFFMDAMNAFLLYIGIYASGVMRWNSTEMLIFGLAFGTFAAAGGIVGPMLDSRVGPRDALRIEIAATLAALVFLVGLAPDHVLFTFATQPGRAVWNGPVFRTLPELCFLASALFAATAVVAHFASSRTLLTRLTPPGQSGIYFGLFALSGTSTLWLGSLAVSLGTAAFHSQQAGFGSVALLMLLGLVGLSQVQDGAGHLDV